MIDLLPMIAAFPVHTHSFFVTLKLLDVQCTQLINAKMQQIVEFVQLINVEMPRIVDILTLRSWINNCWYFNIYELDNFLLS